MTICSALFRWLRVRSAAMTVCLFLNRTRMRRPLPSINLLGTNIKPLIQTMGPHAVR